jgi:hypothetical protein
MSSLDLENGLKPVKMELLGTDPICEASSKECNQPNVEDPFSSPSQKPKLVRVLVGDEVSYLFPSDHFGLFTEFESDV